MIRFKIRYLIPIYVFVFSLITFPTMSVGDGNGKEEKEPGPGFEVGCGAPEEIMSIISLTFPSTYSGRTHHVIPAAGSDPSLATPGKSLYSSFNTFYCVVTVIGAQCVKYSKTYIWDKKSYQMEIAIPTHTDFTLAVEFYEQCGLLDENSSGAGRPMYAYSQYFGDSQGVFDIPLRYTRTESCD